MLMFMVHAAEGVHMRCFEHVWVCRSKEGSYPFGYMAGQAIAASLKPTLPDVSMHACMA